MLKMTMKRRIDVRINIYGLMVIASFITMIGLVHASSITILPVNALNYSEGFNVIINGTLNLSYSNIITLNVIGSNNLGNASFTINAPRNNAPSPINEIISNGEHNITINNVHIFPPRAIHRSINITPENSSFSTSVLLGDNVTLNYTVNAIPQNNLIINATYGQVISFPEINAVVDVPYMDKCSITQTFNPPFSGQQYYSNTLGPCNINITELGLNLSKINDSVLEQVFNNYVSVGCAPGANITFYDSMSNTPLRVCSRKTNQPNVSILTIIASYDSNTHNVTQGVGQGFIAAIADDNASAKSQQQVAMSCYNHYEDPLNRTSTANALVFTSNELAACQTNATNSKNGEEANGFLIGLVVLIFVGGYAFMTIRRKRDREDSRPKSVRQ